MTPGDLFLHFNVWSITPVLGTMIAFAAIQPALKYIRMFNNA